MFNKTKTYEPEFNNRLPEDEKLTVTIKVLNRFDFVRLTTFTEEIILNQTVEYLEFEKTLLEKYATVKKGNEVIPITEIIEDARYGILVQDIVTQLLNFSILPNPVKKKSNG